MIDAVTPENNPQADSDKIQQRTCLPPLRRQAGALFICVVSAKSMGCSCRQTLLRKGAAGCPYAAFTAAVSSLSLRAKRAAAAMSIHMTGDWMGS